MASKFILEMKSQRAKAKRNWQSVIELNTRIISIDKNYSFAYYDIANAYDHLGNTDTSLEFARKAIEINPKDFFTLQLITRLYNQRDEHDKTYKYAKRSLDNLPDDISPPPMKLFKSLRVFRIIPIINKLYRGLSKEIANWGNWRQEWTEWANSYISWYEKNKLSKPIENKSSF